MAMRVDEPALVRDYTPVLVLYPEIPAGTTRERNENYPHESPLLHDYHPRDVRMVLEHSSFHSRFGFRRGKTRPWDQMLDRMERSGYEKDLDVMPGVDRDNRAEFWKAYAAIPKDQERYQRACYARVARGKGINSERIVAQYWYPYLYNDFWNTHEMDWECVSVAFKLTQDGPRPTICAYSAHLGGHWLPWSTVQKVSEALEQSDGGTHPVAYVANGSHANYFHGAAMYATAPPLVTMAAGLLKKRRRLVDYTTSWEEGDRHLVEAKLIPPSGYGQWDGEWRWLNQKGLWGSPGEFLDLEFKDSGPAGPPRAGDIWDHPFRWIDTSCTRAPSPRESVVPSQVDPQGA